MTTLALSAATIVRRDPDWIFRQLQDPRTFVSCVPGATVTRMSGPRSFEARIAIGFGPLRSRFNGKGRIIATDSRRRTASLEVSADPGANSASVRIRMAMAIAERNDGSEIRMTFDAAMSEGTWLLAHAWLDQIACDLLDRTTRRLKLRLEEEDSPEVCYDEVLRGKKSPKAKSRASTDRTMKTT